jgi:hypothetical protein
MKQDRQAAGRIKAPRGCENLKVQAVGLGKPDHLLPLPSARNTL